jgi:hypothetical protein
MASRIGGVDWEKGLYAVVVAAQCVRPDNDAALRGVVVYLGTIVLRIGIQCDAARLAKVAIGRRLKIVVFRMGANKVGLLPMKEVGIAVESGELDGERVVAP